MKPCGTLSLIDNVPKIETNSGICSLLTRFGATLRELSLRVGGYYREDVDVREMLDLCPNVLHLRLVGDIGSNNRHTTEWIPPAMRSRLITLELVDCMNVSAL